MNQPNLRRALLRSALAAGLATLAGCGATGGATTEAVGTGGGASWREVERIASAGRSFAVNAKFAGARSRFRIGEPINMDITSAQSGRLWVLQVTSDDKVDQLFPNANFRDNAITAGRVFALPPAGVKWDFAAGEPIGPSRVMFIVTTGTTTLKDAVATTPTLRLLLQPDSRWSATSLNMEVTR